MLSAESFLAGEAFSEPVAGTTRPVLTFGQYAGLTYAQVMANDPGYCQWHLDNLRSSDDAGRHFADWLRAGDRLRNKRKRDREMRDAEPDEVKRARVADFGKHRSETWGQLLDNRPGYCLTLIEKQGAKPVQGSLKEFLRFAKRFSADLEARLGQRRASIGASARKLGFGQHRNKTFSEVLEGLPGYCLSLVALQGDNPSSDNAADFIAYVRESGVDLAAAAEAKREEERRREQEEEREREGEGEGALVKKEAEAEDVLPDVAPVVLPDVVPVVLPDVVPDVLPDVVPDVLPDVVPLGPEASRGDGGVSLPAA